MTRSPARLVLAVLALALLGATAGCGAFGDERKTVSAYFDRTVGVYVASDVRVLGVRIGEITAIEPEGDKVRVDMAYDADINVPADAQAVIVAPSIVSDRYVQLTPVWQAGPVLDDGATLSLERTAEPVELDEIYAALDELNQSLGPNGANKDGALSDLIAVGAENLQGNGQLLGTTLEGFSQAVSTLADQREDLFGTVANLQDFTTTIARSDDTVRAFNRDLAAVADQLEAEREDLATAVRQLSVALGEVATFVRDNEEDLTENVSNLASVTGVLVKQRQALEEFLSVAPTALSNLQLAYNPSSGTLDTRDNGMAQREQDPVSVVCDLLLTIGQPQQVCDDIAEAVAGGLPAPPSGGEGGAPQLPGLPAGGTAPERDLTLGGILDGRR